MTTDDNNDRADWHDLVDQLTASLILRVAGKANKFDRRQSGVP
jgi:hypothetical protein